MKTLLTGITGNLGFEVAQALTRRNISIIPCVLPGKKEELRLRGFETVVECDLMDGADIEFSGDVDCITHCAGVVSFRGAGNKNEQMARKVVNLAGKLDVPVYFVSTAFVYKPPGSSGEFNNDYERDKFNAEQLLIASNMPHTIFRPSVLTGNSQTGEIRNFSGYNLIVRAFLSAIQEAKVKNRTLRFPRMLGASDMVPVDQAAESIGQAIQENRRGILYITNPTPPRSEWVLDETLNFYGIRDSVTIMDISFEEFGKLNLTDEETGLYRFASHFNPYWSMEYSFPQSVCTKNVIDHEYLTSALTFFRDSEHHGKDSY